MISHPLTLALLRSWMGEMIDAFSPRTRNHVLTLLAGTLLTPGRRTVAAALRVMGLGQVPTFTSYHRVLNRNTWSSRDLARRLLMRLLRTLVPPAAPVIVGLDDTLERRRGAKIAAKGIYRDPVRSSRSHFVKASGLRWLSLMLLAPVPVAHGGSPWALPFLTVLAPSERYHQERGRRHKPLLAWGRQMLLQLRRWLPEHRIIAVADSSFAALEFLGAVRRHVTLITRLRLDANLFAPPPPRRKGQNGRPRRKGERLPKLDERLARSDTPWRRVTITDWYGEGERTVEIASETAVWFHAGLPVVPLRWVLVRDPERKFKPQAFLCTDEAVDPAQILHWFIRRWRIEVTFEEARRHLGVETQRQWTDKAIARTTPALLALFSLVTLWAGELLAQINRSPRRASWYAKPNLTFSDALGTVRHRLWWPEGFAMSEPGNDPVKVPRALVERLTDTLCYAA
jgi:DDE superfamily endonuclease